MAKKIFGNISSNILTNFFIFKIGGIIAKKSMLIGAREEKKKQTKKTGKREKNNQQKRKRETEKNKNAEKFGKPKPNFLVPLFLTAF